MKDDKIEPSVEAPIGDVIDSLYAKRAARLALNKQVEEMKREEKDITSELFERMNQMGLEGAKGKLCTVSQYKSTICSIQDWDKALPWLIENGHTHLLQKKLSDPSYRELLALGIEVPGTSPLDIPKLSITRSKK